jgi:hypothetical protein
MKHRVVGLAVCAWVLLAVLFPALSAHAQQQPSLFFFKGVGTPDCQQSSEITVTAGTDVQYCYQLQNNGEITYTITATITDDKLGPIATPFVGILGLGESRTFTQTARIDSETVNIADVAATLDYGFGAITTTQAGSARVNVQQPPLPQLHFFKGVGTVDCQQSNEITVTAGTDVLYCYQLQNNGEITYTITATITDDKLGPIASPFAGILGLGESRTFTKTARISTATVNEAVVTATLDTGFEVVTAAHGGSARVNVQQPPLVPALSEWGLVVFMLLIVTTSIYYLRRRKV